jgi:hypothetical protein
MVRRFHLPPYSMLAQEAPASLSLTPEDRAMQRASACAKLTPVLIARASDLREIEKVAEVSGIRKYMPNMPMIGRCPSCTSGVVHHRSIRR